MFGWSSAQVSDQPSAPAPTTAQSAGTGRSALTRLLVDRIQHSQRDPFAIVMLQLAGRSDDARGQSSSLPPAARDALVDRVAGRLQRAFEYTSLEPDIAVLVMAGVDTRAALEPLRQVLTECCQHTVLADRQCYSVRWRLAAAFYPADGHAPCRLLREVQSLLRTESWLGRDTSRHAADTAASIRAKDPGRFQLPASGDPLALV